MRQTARTAKPADKYLEYQKSLTHNTVNHTVMSAVIKVLCQDMFQEEATDKPIALMARSNSDTLYYHQAMKVPRGGNF